MVTLVHMDPEKQQGGSLSHWLRVDNASYCICSHCNHSELLCDSSQPFNFPGLSSAQGGQFPLALGLPQPWSPGKRERGGWKASKPLDTKQVHWPCGLRQPGLRKQFKPQELNQGARNQPL